MREAQLGPQEPYLIITQKVASQAMQTLLPELSGSTGTELREHHMLLEGPPSPTWHQGCTQRSVAAQCLTCPSLLTGTADLVYSLQSKPEEQQEEILICSEGRQRCWTMEKAPTEADTERNCCVKVQTAFPREHNDSSALLISISSWLSSHKNKSQLFLQFPLLRAEYGIDFSRRLDRTGALLGPRRGGGNALPLPPAHRSSLRCVYAPGYQHPALWLMEAAGGTLQSLCINGTSDNQKRRIPTPQCQDFLLCIHQKLPLCSKTRLVQLFISQT